MALTSQQKVSIHRRRKRAAELADQFGLHGDISFNEFGRMLESIISEKTGVKFKLNDPHYCRAMVNITAVRATLETWLNSHSKMTGNNL